MAPRMVPARLGAPRVAPAAPPGLLDRLRGLKVGPFHGNGDRKQTAWAPAGNVAFAGGSSGTIVSVSGMLGAPSPNAERLTRSLAFATAAYCFTAMDFRGRKLAEPPLMVVRETEDGEVWQPDHRLAELFDAPRPDLDMGELLHRTQLYRDATAAAVWVIDLSAGKQPARLSPFPLDQVKIEQADDLIYGRYRVLVAGGQWRPVERERVIHFRDQGFDWYQPVSRVDVALTHLNLGHQMVRIVKGFLERAMFPGGVISPDKEWRPSEPEWETWKAMIEEWAAGPANAGAPLALPGGTTFSKAAQGLTDLLPDVLLDRIEAVVGSVFQVPPVVLGWLVGLRNSPWSQMAEARRQAYEDGIVPLWRDVERRITRVLLTPAERARGELVRFDTSHIVALQEDEERRSRIAALNADHWTVDERRVYTGQEPLDPSDERGRVIVGIPSVAPAFDGLGMAGPGPEQLKANDRDLQWIVFDFGTKAASPRWESTVYRLLQEQRARIVALARRKLFAVHVPKRKDGQPVVLDLEGDDAAFWRALVAALDDESAARGLEQKAIDDRGATEFLLALTELLGDVKGDLAAQAYTLSLQTGGSAVRRVGARLGLSFQVLEPGLQKFAREHGAFLAEVMGKITGEAVAAAVQRALNEGETIRGLIGRLEALPAFDRARAKLTARTETTRAWNGAQRRSLSDYARASGSRVRKAWLSARDDRVRDEHRDLDGEERDVDQPFSNGLMEPGEPNCRCTLTYAVRPPDAGAGTQIDEGG